MNSKLAKFSTEQLEQKLKKMEKFQKLLNWVVIIGIFLIILPILEGKSDTQFSLKISMLALALISKYYGYPTQMGKIKSEINNRNSMNQNSNIINNHVLQSNNQNASPNIDNTNNRPKYCSNCGSEVNGAFCNNCGTKIVG